MNMKCMLACMAMMVVSAFAESVTYWVDDDGSDANSGTSPTLTGETTPGGLPVGPKRTLKAGLGLARSGDTVCVLPGHYSEGVMTNAGFTARAIVSDGVKLVSRDGRDVTFIHGAAAVAVPDPDNRSDNEKACGLGMDAVRCVRLDGSGSIFGFTLLDGHARAAAGGSETAYCFGGGVNLGGSGCAVDCVISNCFAVRGAAAYRNARTSGLVNSIVTDCRGTTAGAGVYQVGLWNCIIGNITGSYPIYNTSCYNCTIKTGLRGSGVSYGWNTVLTGTDSGNNIMTNSYTTLAGNSSSDWSSPDNRRSLTLATQLLTDPADMPVYGKHLGIDMANWLYYTNNFPAVASDYMYKDAYGRKRVVNGAMDVGAVECDYIDAFTADLSSSSYFAVQQADVGVYEKKEDSTVVGVAIPVGNELQGKWTIPEYDTYNETYGLTVALSGDAVLKVYVDDQLKLTIRASQTAEYLFAGNRHDVRFVCEGTSGEAVLAVLTTTAHKPYFVSPEGDDAHDGLTPETPKETLAAIAAIATEKGCVIHAASGVYNKGFSGRFGTLVTTNRVILASGVGLVGDAGAAATVIEGVRNTDGFAYATNVVRCCYLRDGAWIRGFTLRNGAAAAISNYGETGGALTSNGDAAAIECVFTNNVAVRGASASEVTLIRCYVIANGAGASYGDFYGSAGTIVDCVFSDGAGAYTKAPVVNSTFGKGSQLWSQTGDGRGVGGTNDTFNSIIDYNSSYRSFRNCILLRGLGTPATSVADADCRLNVSDTVDANMRPTIGSTNLIDRAKDEYYDTYFPAKWVRFKNGRDFSGGLRRIGSSMDIGAGEFDWGVAQYPGLDISITAGAEDGTWDVAISRGDAADNRCTGFVYGDETIVFGEHPVGWTWTKTVTEYPSYYTFQPQEGMTLYVDPVNGDDGNPGYHPTLAYATIHEAMEHIAPYGTIHCAKGTYSPANGNCVFDGSVSNVVDFTKDYVTLVADAGADETFIEGVYDNTSNAVRGVSMRFTSHSTVRGFTIRNCGAPKAYNADGSVADLYAFYGAGVYGGAAVECVVSNCWSGSRGGAGFNVKFVRCHIGKGNKADRVSYDAGGYACNYYGSVVESMTYASASEVVGCTYLGTAPYGVTYPTKIYDSFIGATTAGISVYSNCVVCGALKATDTDAGGNVFNANASDYAIDPDTFRPAAGSPLINAASLADFEALMPEEAKSRDFAGGQRVYDAAPDIGAGEYDARSDFANRIGRRVTVDTATPMVELGEGASLTMRGGDALELRWRILLAGDCSFRVICDGGCTATVTVNGVELTPDANGVYSFVGSVGEQTVSIACEGAGTATIDGFTCPHFGWLMRLK